MSDLSRDPADGVVVFERDPYWGPELKRQFAGDWVVVRECRSLNEIHAVAADLEHVVILAVIDAAPAEILNWLERPAITMSRAGLIVISSPDWAELEWPIREAGAMAFMSDETPGVRVAHWCRRWLHAGARPARVSLD